MADEADVILNKTSDQVDNILNKWGIPSWTAPEVHHYKFTKKKYVRPERLVSNYLIQNGTYNHDLKPISVSQTMTDILRRATPDLSNPDIITFSNGAY